MTFLLSLRLRSSDICRELRVESGEKSITVIPASVCDLYDLSDVHDGYGASG